MYISESMVSGKRLTVKVTVATTYDKRDGVYADHPAPGERWICIGSGQTHISLRLTRGQLDSLARGCEVAIREIDAESAPLPDRDMTQPADGPTVKGETWVALKPRSAAVLADCQASSRAEAEEVLATLLPGVAFDVALKSDLTEG